MADVNNPPLEGSAGAGSRELAQQPPGEKTAKKQYCRYFHTRSGCRNGSECLFRHNISDTRLPANQAMVPSLHANESTQFKAADREGRAAVRHVIVAPSMVVSRPVPRLERDNPRAFQIQQIKKRFSRTKEEVGSRESTVLNFDMDPSDPDFPFDIGTLKCALHVPADFPKGNPPTLRIKNPNMERGYQINVENWFSITWSQLPNPTLFGVIKALDKRLEEVLTAKKSDTIKLVPNSVPSGSISKLSGGSKVSGMSPTPEHKSNPVESESPGHQKQKEKVSPQKMEEARKRRQVETQVLEHRLRSLQRFSKYADGTTYTIPLEPRKLDELPPPLRRVDSVRLFVPWEYNHTPCRIELLGVDGFTPATAIIESAFRRHVEEQNHLTLLSHLNWLTQNMHSLAILPSLDEVEYSVPAAEVENMAENHKLQPNILLASDILSESRKDHIKYIPRPPEWLETSDIEFDDSNESSSTSSGESGDEDYDKHDSNDELKLIPEPTGGFREKGILLSFPLLELYGIELLELVSLNITVKCTRCKDTSDVNKIQSQEPEGYAGPRSEFCKKCALAFGIAYRKDLMHSNSVRAGYLDMDGCTPVDLQPSSFIPTCSGCSTPYPRPGIVSVRGDASIAICRECHQKMTFKLTEVKLLHVGVSGVRAPKGLPRKKKKDSLGITAGEELPKRGKCKHYGKSYRWFRFSCCSKVYPCDKCHDEASPDHPNEFATRMICGHCSREQNYRPEDCGFCKAGLTGKARTGFWEGGKGTRDRMRMSRKDPRKYKRRPGSKINS